MAYTALARKYRPKKFTELIGQDHVVRALSNALETGRVHHAFLFTGTRGVGKTTIARIFAQRFSEVFGKSFYVENKVGANGTIAAEAVAHSKPDGYTLFMAATPQISISPAMMNVQYDPVKDFVPISAVITNTFALVVNAKLPASTRGPVVATPKR